MDEHFEVPGGKIHRSTDGGVTVACGRTMTGLTPVAPDEVRRIRRRKGGVERFCKSCDK